MEAAIGSKCKHQQSHFDFLNTVSKENSYWVSLSERKKIKLAVCVCVSVCVCVNEIPMFDILHAYVI